MSGVDLLSGIEALFTPKSICVVGASGDPDKVGGRPIKYLQKHGYSGEIYPVNPKLTEVAGLTCYPNAAALPKTPDVALVLVGAAHAPAVVADLSARGTKAAVLLAGGFAEAGPEGERRQAGLKTAAGSMRLLGPNTIGAVNLTEGITLSASGALELGTMARGSISVASQSGGILGSLLSRGAARGIGFARLAATGNEADIDIGTLIGTFVADPNTDVILAYIEGIRDLEAFRRSALQAQEAGKQIIAFKVGRSDIGARSTVSHTGAMAGNDRLYDALFLQLGIIRAQSLDELLDLGAALASGRRMGGGRLAILTTTGGAGSLVSDALGLSNCDVPLLSTALAEDLGALVKLPPSDANPVDLTLAGAAPVTLGAAVTRILRADEFDGLLVVIGSSALSRPQAVIDALASAAGTSVKPILCYVSPDAPDILNGLNRASLPAFTRAEAAGTLFKALTTRPKPSLNADCAEVFLPDTLPERQLSELEAAELFSAAGIASAHSIVVTTAKEARTAAEEIGGKVVLKLLSTEVLHKSDLGGVRLSLTAETIEAAFAEMVSALQSKISGIPVRFIVQKMVSGGLELILGIRRDPQLGSAVMLGSGGVQAELYGDSCLRLVPLGHQDGLDMIEALKIAPILKGYRGSRPLDVAALTRAIIGISNLAAKLGERLVEAEINPLLILPEGEGVIAVDGVAVLIPGGKE